MPVQHCQLLIPHGEEVMLVHTLDRREPNLRRIALAQLRTKRSGDNLMPQAYTENRLA